jgi:hypothetical protein
MVGQCDGVADGPRLCFTTPAAVRDCGNDDKDRGLNTHTHTLRVEDPGTFLMNFLKRRKKTSDLPHDLREKKAASKDAFYSFSVCGPSGEFFYGV